MAAPFVPQDALKKLRTVARAKGLHVWVDHQARITGKLRIPRDGGHDSTLMADSVPA